MKKLNVIIQQDVPVNLITWFLIVLMWKEKRYFVEIDGISYPKDSIETNYSEIKFLDQ